MTRSRSGLRLRKLRMIPTSPSRHLLVILALSLCQVLSCGVSFGQNVEGISQREIVRRQRQGLQAADELAIAQAAMKERNWALAHDHFRVAVVDFHDAPIAGNGADQAMDGFCESGVKLAELRISEGKYNEAEMIVSEVLSDRYSPNCHDASQLLVKLKTPGYFNRTMGPK